MKCIGRPTIRTAVVVALGLALIPAGRVAADASAEKILRDTKVQGGLVVHIGCGDGKLTAALRATDSYTVHGLDADADNVAKAREHIGKLGLYGKVSVEQWTSNRLPYVANLVNLIVSDDLGDIPMTEVMRVLAPLGVAYVGGKKTVKPWPKDIDEWTHFLHDAGNNAVAHDTRVGPPRSMHWVAGPLWLRSHETPSGFEAMVSGGGRVFYLLDEGLIGITDQRLPERWALICRDAFNGKLLWRRPVGPWGWPEWARTKFADKPWTKTTGGRTVVPTQNHRRFVVEGDRLYATMEYLAPLTILDATSGKTLSTVKEASPVRQIVVSDGVAVVYSQAKASKEADRRKGKKTPASSGSAGKLLGVEGATGKVIWRTSVGSLGDTSLAVDGGRVIYHASKMLTCLDLRSGKEIWKVQPQVSAKTLVVTDGVVLLVSGTNLEARDAGTGQAMWNQKVLRGIAGGIGGDDLFVIDGVVWPGMAHVDSQGKPSRKTPNVLAIGYDLRTGRERKRVHVPNLLSPEHHHRCYRNKATDRYIIGSMEGAEFVDLQGSNHGQNNFIRGVCKMGMMPSNGLLYVPPDQCFCQPGGKVLGLTAMSAEDPAATKPIPDRQRLQRGPAYDQAIRNPKSAIRNPDDWPTYRHDAARHASTPAIVAPKVKKDWRVKLGTGLTAPVAVGDRVYAASKDTHTIHALDAKTGRAVWTFVAGGRVDSPPTVHNGLILFGSADGRVYCLRASDGAMVWRFLAAPYDRRISCFDQVESAWPVHGSVLIRDGIAYVSAGRSTYLDGGIRFYGLDPATGRIIHQNTLSGPWPGEKNFPRDVAFYVRGANSDVLVSEGDAIYMRQKRLTPSLQEQPIKALSSKGESDVGTHVFSTAGLLDGSWYNRTFWMYAKRWPGFQLANQAPKAGQLLVVGDKNTYAVRVFYYRNVHSPMFFPGKEGYLLFADRNDNEPQIVGETGSRKPVRWLPMSDYHRRDSTRKLESKAFGQDKGIGYTRAEPPLWKTWIPVRMRAMVKAADTIFVAGPPDEFDEKDPYASFEGRNGARLVAVCAKEGKKLTEVSLDTPPVFDGMIATTGRLFIALEDGSLMCLTGESK